MPRHVNAALALLVALASCRDERSSGLRDLHAVVFDRTGRVAPGTLVRLEAIADDGETAWTGIAELTGDDGEVELTNLGDLSPGFVVVAYLPRGRLMAPALADGDSIRIHPVTQALVEVILVVTAAAGGPSWADLDTASLRSMHNAVTLGLDEGRDLTDTAGLADWARSQVGDTLVKRFPGDFEALPAAWVLGADLSEDGPDFSALDPPPPGWPCNRRHHVLAGVQFYFDLVADGSICDGNDGNQFDAFDLAFILRIRGDTFVGGDAHFPAQTTTRLEDDRELVFGPAPLGSGLEVTRKVYVTPQDDVARYLEIVHNPASDPVTIDLEIAGNLGSDADTVLFVTETQGGRVAAGDHYAATLQMFPLDPTVGYVWDGYGLDLADRLYFPPDSFGAFSYTWQDVSVKPGETLAYAHFVLLSSARDQATVAEKLAQILAAPPLKGLSAVEVAGLRNFHTTSLANVRGGPGTMAPGLLFSLRNRDTHSELASVARLDGSFDLLLIDAEAGHVLEARSPGGALRRVTVAP